MKKVAILFHLTVLSKLSISFEPMKTGWQHSGLKATLWEKCHRLNIFGPNCIWKCFKFRCPVGSICILTLSVMRPLLRVCWLIISLAKCQSLRSHGSDISPKVFPFLQTSIFCALFFLFFFSMFTLFLTSLSTVSGLSLCFQPLPLIIDWLSHRTPAEDETDSKSNQINCFYLKGFIFRGRSG